MKFLDRLKEELFCGFSNKQVRKAIDGGCCLLNGKVHRVATTPVEKRDQISFLEKRWLLLKEKPSLSLVYEDQFLSIMEKPTGISCETNKWPGLVHRLDKETSGLLIFAKEKEAEKKMKQLFQNGQIEKKYFAIVVGQLDREKIISLPIGRLGREKGFEHFGIVSSAPLAITKVVPLASRGRFTYVACYPKTGKTHQIRIHLASLGLPILGDLLYAPQHPSSRMYLHAEELRFPHPITGEAIHCISKNREVKEAFRSL